MAKDYQTYTLLDFITDEYFKSWVLEPTAEQDYFWQSWIANHPEKAKEVSKAREFILSINFQKQPDLQELKSSIYGKVIAKSKEVSREASYGRVFPTRFTVLKIAATLTLLISLSVILYQVNKKTVRPLEVHKITYETKITQRGEKLSFVLPDGSIVKLNSESKLRYPTSFETQRVVHLQGEAYFGVERDTLKPFKVKTEQVTTEVLGTSFNVNFNPNDSIVQIAVTSGEVAIYSLHLKERHHLLPTEVLTYEHGKFIKSHFDEEILIGWKDGILAFNDADIAEITQRLSAWYDVDFDIRGQTEISRRFSGKFKNRSLRHVLEGIAYTSNFEFNIQHDKVTLHLK